MHNFSHHDETIQRSNKFLIRTTYSKYYQSAYVKAKEYELIRIISKDTWHIVKEAFNSLVKNASENMMNGAIGKPWSMELIPPDLDAQEYTPMKLPVITPPVIYGLGGGHTHTQIFWRHKSDF